MLHVSDDVGVTDLSILAILAGSQDSHCGFNLHFLVMAGCPPFSATYLPSVRLL